MYLQTSSAARFHIHCPTHFSASSNTFITFPRSGSVSRQILGSITKPGFCRSAKRLPGTKTGMRNHGGGDFVGCRCQGQRVGGDEEGSDDDDGFYIRRAVELARKAIGCTSPNPMVGCVIVKDGKVVGEGFHPKAGQPHAEVFALRDAGDLAENATAYVSLEPCNHYGRTPPCTEALIKAKVKRVVVGMVDPNPIVASKGVDRLRDAGIHVTVGVEEEMCKKLNEAYIHQMLKGKPFVALRYSISVDGHFVDQLSEENTETDEYYSQLLQEYDAIVLSSTSITEQFPFPSSKQLGPSQPLHIVIARNPGFQIPLQDTEANSKLIIFTDKESTVGPETGAPAGIETVVLNKIDLVSILDYCKRRGLCSVLLDVRGNSEDYQEILKEGFEQNLLQKVLVEVVPIWNGNNEQSLPVALTGLNQRVRNLTSRNLNRSVLLEGYFD